MIKTLLVSSLEKPLLADPIGKFKPLTFIRMMKNQRLSVQLLHTLTEVGSREMLKLTVSGGLSVCANAFTVEQVPCAMPVWVGGDYDDNFVSKEPGLYPDWLRPLHYGGHISVVRDQLRAVWIEFDPQDTLPAGTYETVISLVDGNGNTITADRITIEMLDADLPEQTMKMTQWFHCDCLANYYNCEPWSERHWAVVESFAKTAVRNGINLLLTPLFTPPLDTAVGGERLTTQLVDVTVTNGAYSFGFDKLDRWIEMCDRVGVKFFEISHLFTQWGGGHAPKVMATVDGEYRRIFGWDTDAHGAEYATFLRTVLPAFLDHMKARGDDTRCLFHISDEPNETQLESYQASKAIVADILEGYTIMDALSNFVFWEKGIVTTPIPSNDHVDAFINAHVPGLWTYYCCGQGNGTSNRFIAMPGWRNRSIGMQFYKYDIAGFLQWGYNFYNNMSSVDTIDPYSDPSGEYWVPAGDTFSVYPGQDGTALESTRIKVFYEALEDCRAMKLCESFYGKDKVVAEIEKAFGGEIRFSKCAWSAQQLLAVRGRVDEMIADALYLRQ